MRILCLAILTLVLIPLGTATTFEDAAGDTTKPIDGDTVDILSLSIDDLGAEIRFTIHIGSVVGSVDAQQTQDGASFYFIDWEIAGDDYTIKLVTSTNSMGAQRWTASIAKVGEWERLPRHSVDVNANLLSVWIPRAWMSNEAGDSLWGAEGITNLVVRTQGRRGPFELLDGWGDRMPDAQSLEWAGDYGHTTSDFDAHVFRPLRQSNGGAQTMLFDVILRDAPEGEYAWRLVDAPVGWDVVLPAQTTIKAENAQETLLLSIGAAHGHGGVEEVRIAIEGPSRAEIVLGVAFATPPFPTAHHPDLFIHTRYAGEVQQAFMNTLSDDALDSEGEAWFRGADEFELQELVVPLEPVLGTPMLADPDGLAGLRLEIVPATEAGIVAVSANVTLSSPSGRVTLWQFPTAHYSDPAPGTIVYEESGEWVYNLTRIEPQELENLELHVLAFEATNYGRGYPIGPKLRPGGTLSLPLFEYQPDVVDFFEERTGLALSTDAPSVLRAAPGSVISLPFSVANRALDDADVSFSVSETIPGWATVTPAKRTLDARSESEVFLQIVVPEDAAGTNEIRLLMHKGGSLAGVHPLSVFVDASVPLVQDEVTGDVEQSTPALGVVPLLILGFVLARGRRRG